MRCKRVVALSSAYLEGELSPATQSAYRGHLRVCESCRERVEEEAAIASGLAALSASDDTEPPAALWGQVAARLAAEEIADSRRPGWQLLWARVRPHMGVAGLLLGASMAAAVLWIVGEQMDKGGDGQEIARSMTRADGGAVLSAKASLAEARRRDIARTDELYRDTISELRAVVDSERGRWPEARATAVTARLAEIEAQKQQAREKLLTVGFPDTRARDALYSAYQAEIMALQEAVMVEIPEP